jgi:spermidine synthase
MREDHPRHLDVKPALPALALGWLASTAQIYLLREFSAQFHGSELTYAFVLAAWLFWGGVGSAVAGRLRSARPDSLVCWQAAAVFLLPVVFLALRFSRVLLGLVPGESAGMGAALLFAAGAGLALSLPLGVLFAINVRAAGGDAGRAYLLESAGAALGSLTAFLILIPFFPSSAGAAAAAWLSLVAVAAGSPRRKRFLIPAAAAVMMILWTASDGLTRRAAWRPFRLVETLDSRYSRLSVIKTEDQITLYSDGQPVFTSGDREAAEEAVHFALLQRPEARDVLLIGGGAGGAAAEVLKYPQIRPDYVELDPEVLRLAMRHLPAVERRALEDPRLRLIVRDGRAFIQSPGPSYDAVLMNLPEPSTAQLNRYYTREFFTEVRDRIHAGGVFSFTVPGAENYISAARRDFLASLYTTLREVFPETRVVPGTTQVFLASSSELTLDPGELADRISRLGLETSSLTTSSLKARLNPLRLAAWRESVGSRPGRRNEDLSPISYYFGAVLWASQFRGLEAGLLRAAARWPRVLLLGLPLAAAALGFSVLARKKWRALGRGLAPLAVYGLTSIVAEFVLLVAYQVASGLVYGKIALLLGAFMAGLAGGAGLARRARIRRGVNLAALQGAATLSIGLCLILISGRRAEPVYFLALFGLGLIGGALFVEANREVPPDRTNAGLFYAADLFGSSLGALAAAAVVIPLAGVPTALGVLAGVNLLALGYLVLTFRSRPGRPSPGR